MKWVLSTNVLKKILIVISAAPNQSTSNDDPTIVVATPKRDFYITKETIVQPVQEASPPGNDELVM